MVSRATAAAFAFSVVCGVAALPMAVSAQQQPPPIKVACIGNSITAGFHIPVNLRATKSYPAVLGQRLGARYVVQNFGVSSKTLLTQGGASYRSHPSFAQSKLWLPDIVIIQLGSNDAKFAYTSFYGSFQADYEALIQEYKDLPSRPKIYVNLPPWIDDVTIAGAYNWPTNTRLLTLLPKIIAAAKNKNVSVINVHAATTGRATLFSDGLHPNVAGAAYIARVVYAAMMKDRARPVERPVADRLPWRELSRAADVRGLGAQGRNPIRTVFQGR